LFVIRRGIISNIELIAGLGGKYCRSIGAFAKIVGSMQDNIMLIKLRKRFNLIKLNSLCVATFGALLRTNLRRISLGKASYTLRKG